jgi:hypothetical protein
MTSADMTHSHLDNVPEQPGRLSMCHEGLSGARIFDRIFIDEAIKLRVMAATALKRCPFLRLEAIPRSLMAAIHGRANWALPITLGNFVVCIRNITAK